MKFIRCNYSESLNIFWIYRIAVQTTVTKKQLLKNDTLIIIVINNKYANLINNAQCMNK